MINESYHGRFNMDMDSDSSLVSLFDCTSPHVHATSTGDRNDNKGYFKFEGIASATLMDQRCSLSLHGHTASQEQSGKVRPLVSWSHKA